MRLHNARCVSKERMKDAQIERSVSSKAPKKEHPLREQWGGGEPSSDGQAVF
jgi:hypothetical protein